jgi:hypothetical protein
MADTKPAPGMPLPDALAGNFQEAVRWFNQMWGGRTDGSAAGPIPSALMPTLDVKELDKRIADLRSVEHWLQLNQGLLQTTIQGLEMQRNTLAAWQSFGAAASGAAMDGAGAAWPKTAATETAPGAAELPAFQPALWWAALQQQFAQMAAGAAAVGDAAQTPHAAAPPDVAAGPTAAGAAKTRTGSARTAAKGPEAEGGG